MPIYRHVSANALTLKPFPFQRELAMEAYLLDHPTVLQLDDDLFSEVEIIDSELPVKDGRRKNATDGRIDLLATYSTEYIAVTELKLGVLSDSSLDQLVEYLDDACRKEILNRHKAALGDTLAESPKWIGILIGADIELELAQRLKDGYETSSKIPIAGMVLRRFRGTDGTVLVTTDIYFKLRNKPKDLTKYTFNGQTFSKSRLVLSVLRQYVLANPKITYAELAAVFPKSSQGHFGVFTTSDEANTIFSRLGYKRHYIEPQELIQLADAKIAVCTQWGKGNIEAFIELVTTKLHYDIKPLLP